MKQIVDFFDNPYFKILMGLLFFILFFIITSDEHSDTIDARYSVDTECLGTYFPITPVSNTVYKNYALKIAGDKIEETITDSTGVVTERLQSDYLKFYEIYNNYDGEQCKVFCLDKRGRIIKFVIDKNYGADHSKIITKSFASERKPNKKIEDLDYQELYSVYFTTDSTVHENHAFDGASDVSKN